MLCETLVTHECDYSADVRKASPMKTIRCFVPALALTIVAPAFAQSNVDGVSKFVWSENTGWLNFRDAGQPAGAQGVRLHGSFFSGYAWGENLGFINFGDGTPAGGGGTAYANADGADFGVNRDTVTGALSGLAWGENVGWINFTLPMLSAAQQPRYDSAAVRLRGFAWGENIGWINLDDDTRFVQINPCPADFNASGTVTVQDVFDFLTAWFNSAPNADVNGVGGITVQDVFDFLTAWFNGCP